MSKLSESRNWKHFKKLLKNRDFVFSIICYPLVLIVYLFIKHYISETVFDSHKNYISINPKSAFWYALITFGCMVFITFMSIYERIERSLFYKGQGDKLRMKQKEGNWRK